MASINFNQPVFTDNQKTYVYSDLHLDLVQERVYTKSGGTALKNKSDIKLDYNIDAIKNSINNLFNTKKGQRPLYPEFSVDLEQFLFEPISQDIAYKIGKEMQRAISIYESRVTVTKINVAIPATYDSYIVTIVLFIPALSINTIINSSVDYKGFVIQ